MVTSSVRMLYWVLSNSTNLWPAVTLYSILVVGVSSLEEWLIGTSTSSNNSDLCTNIGSNSLLSSRRKTKTGGSLIVIVGDNNSEGSRSTCECTTVSYLRLNVAHNGSLWNSRERKTVSYSKSSLLSAVDVLSSVHSLSSKHKLIITLVTVSVEELNLCNRSSTTRIMDDLLDNSADVSVLLSEVKSTKLYSSLAGTGVSLEDGRLTLSLCL